MHEPDTPCYIWSSHLQTVSDQLPANLGRSSLIHDLHRATGLWDQMRIVQPDVELGTRERLEKYHSPGYLGELRLSAAV